MASKQSHRADEVRFTQNFLHSKELVQHIVKLAGLKPGDTALEIGPGKGIITRELAKTVGEGGQVIAVELDKALAGSLSSAFSQMPHVKILNRDFLHFDLTQLPHKYAVVANVPFNITSILLETLLNPINGPAQAHLILQEDAIISVNERGEECETFKSLMHKPFYQIALVHPFEKSDFTPHPGVETALFAFIRLDTPHIAASQYALYKDFLATVSKDRVGEGAWKNVLSKIQIQKLADRAGLVPGRGIKSQSFDGMIAAFRMFIEGGAGKQEVVKGAMSNLREEQQRREQINRAGGHRR